MVLPDHTSNSTSPAPGAGGAENRSRVQETLYADWQGRDFCGAGASLHPSGVIRMVSGSSSGIPGCLDCSPLYYLLKAHSLENSCWGQSRTIKDPLRLAQFASCLAS